MSEPYRVIMLEDFDSEKPELHCKKGETFTCSGGIARWLEAQGVAKIRNLLREVNEEHADGGFGLGED